MNATSSNLNARRAARGGFTLTELLVVIAIILVITIGALPAVLGGLGDQKYSSAVRTVQAAFAGARDRAITSGQPRGLRFVRDGQDATDPGDLTVWEVSRIQYVGVLEPYSVGTVNNTFGASGLNIIRADAAPAPDPAWELVDPGKDNTLRTLDDIPRIDAPRESAQSSSPPDVRTFASYIRFNQAGPLYQILQVNDSTTVAGRSTLLLASFPPPLPTGTRYQIFGPPVPLASDDTILLPDGLVIDLRTPWFPGSTNSWIVGPAGARADLELLRLPRSAGLPNQVPQFRMPGPDGIFNTADDRLFPFGNDGLLGTVDDPNPYPKPASWPRIDILFASNGMITGAAATADVIHLWIGERADRAGIGSDGIGGTTDDVPTARRHKMLSVVVRSGAIQVEDKPPSVGDPLSTPPYAAIYGRSELDVGVSELPIP